MHTFLLSSNVSLSKSLRRYLRYTQNTDLQNIPIDTEGITCKFWDNFDDVCLTLEKNIGNKELRDTVVFVEPFPESHSIWQAFASPDPHTPAQFFAMLLLVFPEIHWVFLLHEHAEQFISPLVQFTKAAGRSQEIENIRRIQAWHVCELTRIGDSLQQIIEANRLQYYPLFDPLGIRNYLRYLTAKRHQKLLKRNLCAAAIDHEQAYAHLHAYAAYREGYRVWTVTNGKMLQHLFAQPENGMRWQMILDEVFLYFSGHNSKYPLTDLNNRDEKYPGLKQAEHRLFVTTGCKKGSGKQIWQKFLSYETKKKLAKNKIATLYKPAAILNIQRKMRSLHKPNIVWPPREANHNKHLPLSGIPCEFAYAAERLTTRAERMVQEAKTVTDAVHGAILALEAQELIRNRVPKTALAALNVRQQLEIIAESAFYGIRDLKLPMRFKEIDREVDSICEWFHGGDIRTNSKTQAKAAITANLRQKTGDLRRFAEENECWQRLRTLRRQTMLAQKPWYWPFNPLLWYLECTLKSLPRFITIVSMWILAFALLWMSLDVENLHFSHFLGISMQAFLSFDMPIIASVWQRIFIEILGAMHLGVFIAHVYRMLQQK